MSEDPKKTFIPRFDDDTLDTPPADNYSLLPAFNAPTIPRFDDPMLAAEDGPGVPRFDDPLLEAGDGVGTPRFDDPAFAGDDATDETKPEEPALPAAHDYVASIRQNLVEEEEARRVRPRGTSAFLRKMTGSLFRPSESQGGETSQPENSERTLSPFPQLLGGVPEEELTDDFLADRLSGAQAEEAVDSQRGDATDLQGDEPIALLNSGAIAAWDETEKETRAEESMQDWMQEMRQQNFDEIVVDKAQTSDQAQGGKPERKRTGVTGQLLSFLNNIIRRDQAEAPDSISDDMLTGRVERSMSAASLPVEKMPVQEDGQAAEMLDIPEDQIAGGMESNRMPDDFSSPDEEALPGVEKDSFGLKQPWDDTLEFSTLRAELGSEVSEQEVEAAWPEQESDQEQEPNIEERLAGSFTGMDSDEEALLRGLDALTAQDLKSSGSAPVESDFRLDDLPEDHFTRTTGEQPGAPDYFRFTEEDEALLWGQPEQAKPDGNSSENELRADDIWVGQENTTSFSDEQGWNEPVEIETGPTVGPNTQEASIFEPVSEDAYIAEFLGGTSARAAFEASTNFEPVSENAYVGEFLGGASAKAALEAGARQHQTSEQLDAEDDALDAQGLRSIVLEGYQGEWLPIKGEAALGEDGPLTLKSWLARCTPVEKILLVEGILVALAILIAVPYFLFVIFRGPVNQPELVPITWNVPHPLPANVPYPIGLTLPGGWDFALGKSTYSEGAWKPVRAEWLEGTEVRRIVALPWNRQTEAVIQTFQKGDPVQIYLNNQDRVNYKIESIQRLPVDDVSVFSGYTRGLVVVLYQEKATERWVIVCTPGW